MTLYRLLRLGDEEVYRIEAYQTRWWTHKRKWRTVYYCDLWGERWMCEFDTLEAAERHLTMLRERDRIKSAQTAGEWSVIS